MNVSRKIRLRGSLLLFLTLLSSSALADKGPSAWEMPPTRIASVYVAEDFLNEQLKARLTPDGAIKELKVSLDPDQNRIYLRGLAQIPTEELRAINLDSRLGRFRFQMSARISSTPQGHLIVEFPLNETYFYPADSSEKERVIVPVQLLSIALASARGYLAAISGDFGGFDRREESIHTEMKALDHTIAREKNADVLDLLKTRRQSLKIQLEAIPVERKQLQLLSKQYASFLSFTGEKEINLNDGLAARKNALILKIKLSQLVPYLDGIDLGGVRIIKASHGNYLSIDVNSKLEDSATAPPQAQGHAGSKTPPAVIVRLNQSLFQSHALVSLAKNKLGSKAEDFKFEFKDDGLHVSGKARMLLVFPISYETIVDFAGTGVDAFDVRVREIKVAGLDFDFLARKILDALKTRLNQSLKGIFEFSDEGDQAHSHAMKVTVNAQKLIPAFPGLHLIDVDVRPGEFLMKIGKPPR